MSLNILVHTQKHTNGTMAHCIYWYMVLVFPGPPTLCSGTLCVYHYISCCYSGASSEDSHGGLYWDTVGHYRGSGWPGRRDTRHRVGQPDRINRLQNYTGLGWTELTKLHTVQITELHKCRMDRVYRLQNCTDLGWTELTDYRIAQM